MYNLKMINLIGKCFLRITKTIDANINEIKVDELFLKFHMYVSEFGHSNQQQIGHSDDSI